jgi:uncharacterized protein
MRRLLIALACVMALSSGPLSADDFEAGLDAFQEGDYAAAAAAWTRAAEGGDPDAMYNLAVLYESGRGVEEDLAQSIVWYERALEAGVPDAAFNLGNFHREGQGVEQDYQRAIELYEIAAQDGHPGALNNLGGMLLNGMGVEADPETAAQLFYLAAQQGSLSAMVTLGSMFEEGHGVERSFLRAVMLYRAAAGLGHGPAGEHLRTLRPALDAQFPPDATGQDLVAQVQTLLNAVGLDAGPVDGLMGPQTREAIRTFEEAVGRQPTGEPSSAVRADLVEVLLTPADPMQDDLEDLP